MLHSPSCSTEFSPLLFGCMIGINNEHRRSTKTTYRQCSGGLYMLILLALHVHTGLLPLCSAVTQYRPILHRKRHFQPQGQHVTAEALLLMSPSAPLVRGFYAPLSDDFQAPALTTTLSKGCGRCVALEGESAKYTASQTQRGRGSITSQLPAWLKKIFLEKKPHFHGLFLLKLLCSSGGT